MQYVRLMPKAEGGLCKRLTIAGQTFQAGQWYRMKPKAVAMVKGLKQGNRIPYFQIMDEAEWAATTRRELAAAMAGQLGSDAFAALQGLVSSPKVSAPPKSGATKSQFEGLTADEVDSSEGLRRAADDVGKADSDDDDEEEDTGTADLGTATAGPDVDALTRKKDALALAEDYGIELDPDSKLSEMKAVLQAELYGVDEGAEGEADEDA